MNPIWVSSNDCYWVNQEIIWRPMIDILLTLYTFVAVHMPYYFEAIAQDYRFVAKDKEYYFEVDDKGAR